MNRVKVSLAGGLAVLLVAIGWALAQSPPTVARINLAGRAEAELAEEWGGETRLCQTAEAIPSGTSAIRLALFSNFGPRVDLTVSGGGRLLRRGTVGSGWTSRQVTVPIGQLNGGVADAMVCASFRDTEETVTLLGETTPGSSTLTLNGRKLPAKLLIEYLKPGKTTWASLVSSIAHRLGTARALEGVWYAYFVLALVVGMIAAIAVALREQLR